MRMLRFVGPCLVGLGPVLGLAGCGGDAEQAEVDAADQEMPEYAKQMQENMMKRDAERSGGPRGR